MTVEAARRHGQADPRFDARARPGAAHLRLVEGGGALSGDGLEPVTWAPHGLALVDATDEGVGVWEDEGGPAPPDTAVADVPSPALDWYAFCDAFFPGGGRHDFAAVKAYAAYRATGRTPTAAAVVR